MVNSTAGFNVKRRSESIRILKAIVFAIAFHAVLLMVAAEWPYISGSAEVSRDLQITLECSSAQETSSLPVFEITSGLEEKSEVFEEQSTPVVSEKMNTEAAGLEERGEVPTAIDPVRAVLENLGIRNDVPTRWPTPFLASSADLLCVKKCENVSKTDSSRLAQDSSGGKASHSVSKRTQVGAGGSSWTSPSYRQTPKPLYPAIALSKKIEGLVMLMVSIDANGLPEKIALQRSSGFSILDNAAIQAVQNWRFEPARRGENRVGAMGEIPIRFRATRY